MEQPEKTQLLKEEWLQIQTHVENFDRIFVEVKKWSVTVSLAIVVGAFASEKMWPILIGGISALGFWLVETWMRAYQQSYWPRNAAIERYFTGKGQQIAPLQMGAEWSKAFEKNCKWRSILKISLYPETSLPHMFIALIAAAFFALLKFEIISF